MRTDGGHSAAVGDAQITVESGDITVARVDAIVNAANSLLVGGGGVDGAIHAAGGPQILAECQAIVADSGGLATGDAVATGAGRLDAKWVIHTVGPVWTQHPAEAAQRLLRSCYRASVELAEKLGLESVAFPNISTGVFGYPKPEAAAAAFDEVVQICPSLMSVRDIRFVCFDAQNAALYRTLIDQEA